MNWQFLLAEYPRSIMADETSLIVLAVLERKGLTTEEELAEQIKVPPHNLSKILLDLQSNALIEFGRNSVRVSAKGKMLLDRFDIHSGVIEDLLDSLSLKGAERSAYRTVVESYRDASFSQYLNSLCTIKTWETIADQIPRPKRTTGYLAQKNVGKLTLLIRDLRNWFFHAHPPQYVFDPLAEIVRTAITSDERKFKARKESGGGAQAKASFWLSILHEPKPEVRWRALEAAEASLVHSLFVLDDFQKGWEKDVWFDTWCDVDRPVTKKYRSANQFLIFLTDSLPKGDRTNLLSRLQEARALGSSSWWVNEPAKDLSENFLGMLMLSSSISDLTDITGMSEDGIKSALAAIERKCQELLGDEKPEETNMDMN